MHSRLTNLLHWRYYDEFLQENAVYPRKMLTAPSTQLLDDLADTAAVSLHLVLGWSDAKGIQHVLFLLVTGLTKAELLEAPRQCTFDDDPHAAARFSAVARLHLVEGRDETFDAVDGEVTLEEFDPKEARVRGRFSFDASCLGWNKRGYFRNGVFENFDSP
jgi:hypothetical protein